MAPKKPQRHLSEEDKAKIKTMGGLEKLIERFKELLKEQKKRHEEKQMDWHWWCISHLEPLTTNEGFRIGQHENRHHQLLRFGMKEILKT